MSWFFNSDYESFLFSGKDRYEFKSSKMNQEFEYLIHFLEEEPIFTLKDYSSDYISHVETLSGKLFLTDKDPKKAKAWWARTGEMELDRALHSKVTSTKAAIELGFENDAKLVDANSFQPKEGFLYKIEGELSGRGNLLWPKNQSKIRNLIENGATLIEEPLRARTRDFSALVTSDKEATLYRNIVDANFQYKGTLLAKPLMTAEQESFYLGAVDKIRKLYRRMGAEYPFSIDSYFYMDGGREKLCPVSEVNARKTMGYVACELRRKFKSKHAAMLILDGNRQIRPGEGVKLLSPEGNRFKVIYLEADSESDLFVLVESLTRVS